MFRDEQKEPPRDAKSRGQTATRVATMSTARTASGGTGQTATLRRACRFIEAAVEAGETPTLKALAAHCRISPWHLQRSFRQAMGVTPRQYADALRMDRFRAELQKGDGVAAATYGAGYGSSSRVYERAPAALGMTPATYAKGGLGARIAYAVAASPLGPLLAAATGRGICFVALGQAEKRLVQSLKAEFPAASIERDRGVMAGALDAILALIQGEVPTIDLPLDIRATAFQRRVWEALRRIPAGETRTYAELAAEIGRPGAQRAVGRACATNPVALVVPCHRALRSDGGLGGYRWGMDIKQALIEGEAGGKVIHRK
jgi:AraC family transcriptional regulator, regulatory protein of adaptative response / methylated-DNA-[protein]-cysteine methyltransferase